VSEREVLEKDETHMSTVLYVSHTVFSVNKRYWVNIPELLSCIWIIMQYQI